MYSIPIQLCAPRSRECQIAKHHHHAQCIAQTHTHIQNVCIHQVVKKWKDMILSRESETESMSENRQHECHTSHLDSVCFFLLSVFWLVCSIQKKRNSNKPHGKQRVREMNCEKGYIECVVYMCAVRTWNVQPKWKC